MRLLKSSEMRYEEFIIQGHKSTFGRQIVNIQKEFEYMEKKRKHMR